VSVTQSGSFSGTGEHVDFVENEDTVATRTCQRSRLDDVANLLNTVVAGRIQFKNVVAGA
jgi:hypothetical protein